MADNASNAEMANKAVKVIADHRNSQMLRDWLNTGEMKDNLMDIDEACKHLKIDLAAVDEQMLNLVIETARSDNPGKRTEEAIEVVSRVWRSKDNQTITHAPNTWPVGLTSHGNTCYLNSLLQYYFTIKPLREIVLDFEQYRFNLIEHGSKSERVGSLKLRPFEIRAYQKFVNDLRGLFDRMITDPSSSVKPEADLVCRAFLKAEDTEAVDVSAAVSDDGRNDDAEDSRMTGAESQSDLPSAVAREAVEASSRAASVASSVTLAEPPTDEAPNPSQSSFTADLPPSPPPSRPGSIKDDTDGSLRPPLPPRHVTTPERQQTNLSKAEEAARQQQDVTEVMDEILFRLRAAIKPKGVDAREEQLDLFRDIFDIRISEKTFVDSSNPTTSDDYAINILLNIPHAPTDIYSALDEVFDLQVIDHGGKKVRQYKTIANLPPILQINIPRNTYDPVLKRGVKVEFKMHLEDTLYMDRYVDKPGSDIMELRQQCWDWRKRLQAMEAEKQVLSGMSLPVKNGSTAFTATSDYLERVNGTINQQLMEVGLSSVDIDSSLSDTLKGDAAVMETRLEGIEGRMAELASRIANQFSGHTQLGYRLQAVFFHRGGYGHGHYWTYIHDFQNDVWRIYNDEKVELFTNLSDIFDAETWQQGTPTYAVYVRDVVKEQYTEAVARACQPAPVPQPVDEVMQEDKDKTVQPNWDTTTHTQYQSEIPW